MDQKIIQLIDKLKSNTVNRKITWTTTSSETEFKVELNSGTITIDCWELYESRALMAEIIIYNKQGIKVNEWRDAAGSDVYNIIYPLHSIVKEKIFRKDETIDGLLVDLE